MRCSLAVFQCRRECRIQYHVVGLARIQITDYHLPGQDRISAIFQGVASCP
jgi:hypothetical protein